MKKCIKWNLDQSKWVRHPCLSKLNLKFLERKSFKMLTLQRNKWLQNLVGLGNYDQKVSPLASARIIGMSILMGSSLGTCSISLVRFIGNVKVATELMFCAAIYVVVFSSFFIVIANRGTVRGFFFEIQKHAEESECISTVKWNNCINIKLCEAFFSDFYHILQGMQLEKTIFMRKTKPSYISWHWYSSYLLLAVRSCMDSVHFWWSFTI